jgi:hypothetical protein
MGQGKGNTGFETVEPAEEREARLNDESPAATGPPESGRGWFRTTDLSRVKRALSH